LTQASSVMEIELDTSIQLNFDSSNTVDLSNLIFSPVNFAINSLSNNPRFSNTNFSNSQTILCSRNNI